MYSRWSNSLKQQQQQQHSIVPLNPCLHLKRSMIKPCNLRSNTNTMSGLIFSLIRYCSITETSMLEVNVVAKETDKDVAYLCHLSGKANTDFTTLS